MFKDDPKSFVAHLKLLQGNTQRYLKASSGAISGDENGWLTTQDCGPPMVFCFDFIDREGERLFYSITGAHATGHEGNWLDVSRNGYVGFYSAPARAAWGVEVLKETATSELHFNLIDPAGRVVNHETGMAYSKILVFPVERGIRTFLNSIAGDQVAVLCATDIHFLS